MVKSDIQKIKIDIAGGESALSLMLCRDGTVGRQGNGNLPSHTVSVIGMLDGVFFMDAINQFDEQIFAHQGVYDHPEKLGMPINYKIAFLGEKPNLKMFEFRMGIENKDVGNLLPYFDQYIKSIVANTDVWYQSALKEQIQNSKTKPWWKFW
ncbi:hypothetical protein FE810_13780 [Thalassotalea litorea]|uniref:Uncharacterized protein n=1 Tax=Thalassotalea litorea TaxID=2020715 RepID=A0A5R9IE45_9GAMM|nr:hypothetical protein [Thalassotalea litorea]TLU61881.1 hypothetical protein FE810_13780 [Thalassotalea litorea]